MQAGFGRRDITPEYAVPLGGYGNSHMRMSQGWYTRIYATCIAFTDTQGETVLLFTVDQIRSEEHWTHAVRARITAVTGIPGPRIMVCATHTHSGPDIGEALDGHPYFELYVQSLTDAAVDALADRAPIKAFMGRTQVEGMNFVRHYRMSDGSVVGAHFGDPTGKEFLGHTVPVDQQMQLLRLVREEKPDIVMMNWQAHNDTVKETGYNLVSAGYVTHVRNQFEADTGMHFAFFQGASGNQAKISRIEAEKHGMDWIAYGHRLAKEAQNMLSDLQPVQGTQIKTCQVSFEININHDWDHLIEEANAVYDLWKTVGKPEGDALGKQYGFTSSYQARDIRIRYEMAKTMETELNVFSIGDLGFANSYNEVFSTVGRYVRANAPFKQVFWVTGNSRYLPCKEAYDYRSYEADTSMYAKGTAERVQEKLVQMLHSLK